MTNRNYFEIVGVVTNVENKEGMTRAGKNFISVDTTIKAKINGTDCEYDINFYAIEGGKMYETYAGIKTLVNSRVKVSGELRENRYWSRNLNQIVSTLKPRGAFINKANEEDHATFEISGFLMSEPVEHKNKAGELINYTVQVGQANYRNELNVLTLHIEKGDTAILNGIRTFKLRDSINLNGDLVFTVNEVTVESNNDGGFGTPTVRTFVNRLKNFYIRGGRPVSEDTYTAEQIADLIAAYKENDKAIIAAAASASNGDEGTRTSTPNQTLTSRQASLI